jgi:hypothetical protein
METLREKDPDNWQVKRHEETKKSYKVRRCSYCNEVKHNRTTCGTRKEDKRRAHHHNKLWRQHALKYCKEVGLGVGSLVEYYDGWHEGAKLGLVTHVNWHVLTVYQHRHPYSEKPLIITPLDVTQQRLALCFPANVGNNLSRHDHRYAGYSKRAISIAGPVPSKSIVPPKNWESEESSALNVRFEETAKDQWMWLADLPVDEWEKNL